MKSILLISDYIDFNDMGGASRITIEHAKELYKQGYNIYIICGAKSKEMLDIKKTNYADFFIYNYNKKFKFIFTFFKFLKLILKNNNIEKIFFYQPLTTFLAFFLNLKNKEKKYFYFSSWHCEYEFRSNSFLKIFGKKIRKIIEKKCLENSDEIIVLSEYSKNELKKFYTLKKKIRIIKPGVDISNFYILNENFIYNFKNEKKIPKNKKIIFTLRHLNKRTGIDILIESIMYLKQKRNDFFVIIAGIGEQEKEYKLLAEKKHVNDVLRFEGFIKEQDLIYYYNCADIFVIPSKYMEGFGLVILEAMACGIPVIGTNIGAIKEILSFDKESYCNVSSLELSKVLEKYLDKIFVKEKLCSLIKETYSWEKHILNLLEK